MAEIADLNVVDASNVGRFPEGMTIPQINDGARALEGMLARNHRDRSGFVVSSGTSTAYQILTLSTYTAHAAGMWFLWRAHVACGASPTLQVNALAAKGLVRQGGGAIVPGDIAVNQHVLAAYNAALDKYEAIGIGDGSPVAPSYVVASLPTSGPNIAIATNARKNGEVAGAGTGVLAFRVGTQWYACDTGATVAA